MKTAASRQSGFTLVELLVTISIAALLIGLAAPSFSQMTIRNRLSSYSNELITTINVARSEAVRRGTSVTICASNDGDSCGGTWNDGWVVFVDPNADAVRDDDPTAKEDLVRVFAALGTNYSLGNTGLGNSMQYASDGSASKTGIFAFCHDDNVVGARALVITPLRPRAARDSNDDRIPNKDDGNNIEACDAP